MALRENNLLSQFQNVRFWAISALGSKYNPRNIRYIPVVIFIAFLDLASNLNVLKQPLFIKIIPALIITILFAQTAWGKEIALSEETEGCLECHSTLHPGIVEAWKKSRHAVVTPSSGISVDGPGLKVSSKRMPDSLQEVVVGCAECHTLRPSAHKDTFDHNGYSIHVVVSPRDCATCHSDESSQYQNNLMAYAYGNLMDNSVYQLLLNAVNGLPVPDKTGNVTIKPSSKVAKEESCLYCHGTKLKVKGVETRETEYGDLEFPIIEGWPNQGVGRVNLDGSLGSCAACHTRHEFSIETARKPYTCKECHDGPDVPAYRVYAASKHGNIYSSDNKNWNFKNTPWTVGKDFSAPTCAACHMSLLINSEGDVITKRTHEIKDRLPWRLFGLIYAHPHPNSPDTSRIKNKDGLSLATDFSGGFASFFLKDDDAMNESRSNMQASCLACHDKSWVDGHWARLLDTIKETNQSVKTGTVLMTEMWKSGLAVNNEKGGSPFDEYIERVWTDTWLFYGNSIRFSSAMGGGGDYGAFAHGRYHLNRNLMQLEFLKSSGTGK